MCRFHCCCGSCSNFVFRCAKLSWTFFNKIVINLIFSFSVCVWYRIKNWWQSRVMCPTHKTHHLVGWIWVWKFFSIFDSIAVVGMIDDVRRNEEQLKKEFFLFKFNSIFIHELFVWMHLINRMFVTPFLVYYCACIVNFCLKNS